MPKMREHVRFARDGLHGIIGSSSAYAGYAYAVLVGDFFAGNTFVVRLENIVFEQRCCLVPHFMPARRRIIISATIFIRYLWQRASRRDALPYQRHPLPKRQSLSPSKLSNTATEAEPQ